MKRHTAVVGGTVLVAVLAAVGLHLVAAQPGPGAGRGPRMGGMGGPPFGMGNPAQNFDQIDKNKDGKITKDELADWTWERFARTDTDKDGALTRQELEAMAPPGGGRGGQGPGGPGFGPPGFGPRGRGGEQGASFETSTLAKNDAEKKILGVLDTLAKEDSRGMMNVSPQDGRLLRLLTESVGAKNVIEIGTSNGYSAIWFCLALRDTGGKLTTHEIDAERAALARENFKRAGVDSIVRLVEGNAHETVKKLEGPIDVLFLDADKEGYIDYLNQLLPKVRPGGLVIAHNMNPGQADPNYTKAITANPDLETVFLLMEGAGIGVTMKKY